VLHPFCFVFNIGYCRPIPNSVNLQKERPVFLQSKVMEIITCHAMVKRLGENDTCCTIIEQVK
jgi:hypothetical protein